MIAALFVQPDGCYQNLPGVDPWDEKRDARLYAGPWPVVAHPPCARWCQLAHLVQKRWGHKIGDDGGTFAFALDSVRRYGGVLEHPAESMAWLRFGLCRPSRNGWSRDINGGWSTEVCQGNYGHPAIKKTWLYYVGDSPPPRLIWKKPPPPSAQVSCMGWKAGKNCLRSGGKEASATPEKFKEVLLSMAAHARISAS